MDQIEKGFNDEIDIKKIYFMIEFVPKFDGNIKNLRKFIIIVNNIIRNMNYATSLKFMEIINEAKLEGAAYNYIKVTGKTSWADVKCLLIKRFGDPRSLAQLAVDLAKIKQLYGEEVRDFANKIEKILTLIDDQLNLNQYDKYDEFVEMYEKLALKVFICGLRPELRMLLKAARHAKLQDAIEMAEQEEIYLKKWGTQKKYFYGQHWTHRYCSKNADCYRFYQGRQNLGTDDEFVSYTENLQDTNTEENCFEDFIQEDSVLSNIKDEDDKPSNIEENYALYEEDDTNEENCFNDFIQEDSVLSNIEDEDDKISNIKENYTLCEENYINEENCFEDKTQGNYGDKEDELSNIEKYTALYEEENGFEDIKQEEYKNKGEVIPQTNKRNNMNHKKNLKQDDMKKLTKLKNLEQDDMKKLTELKNLKQDDIKKLTLKRRTCEDISIASRKILDTIDHREYGVMEPIENYENYGKATIIKNYKRRKKKNV